MVYAIKLNGLFFKGHNLFGTPIWGDTVVEAKHYNDIRDAMMENDKVACGQIVLVPEWAM